MAWAIVRYNGKPKNNSWARWMNAKVHRKNQNNLVSVVGPTGSGKTWSALSICEIMSELDGVHFGIEHVVFSLIELMNLINSGTLKRGSKIVFDEPQVSIGAREYQSQANRCFNLLASTFRHRNLSLFFCTPHESLLDKSTRKLFHVRMETSSINISKKTCELKPKYLEHTDFKTFPYAKQLIVMYKENASDTRYKSHKLAYWRVSKPSQALIDLYEQKKLAFTDTLNKNIVVKLREFDDSGKSMTSEIKEKPVERKELTERQIEVMKLLTTRNLKQAAEVLGINMSAVQKHRVRAEKKGYKVEEFRSNEHI